MLCKIKQFNRGGGENCLGKKVNLKYALAAVFTMRTLWSLWDLRVHAWCCSKADLSLTSTLLPSLLSFSWISFLNWLGFVIILCVRPPMWCILYARGFQISGFHPRTANLTGPKLMWERLALRTFPVGTIPSHWFLVGVLWGLGLFLTPSPSFFTGNLPWLVVCTIKYNNVPPSAWLSLQLYVW